MRPNEPSDNGPKLPLSGFSVIQAGRGVAIEYCGLLYRLYGADVYVVDERGAAEPEGASVGDLFHAWLRQGKTRYQGAPEDFAVRGEGCLVLAGQSHVDVRLARNWAGRLPRPANLLELTWFSAEGPYHDWVADDVTIFALCGAAYSFGHADGAPTLPRGHLPQMVAGVTAFLASLAAFASHSDRGPISVNVFEAAMCLTETQAISLSARGQTAARFGINRYVPMYPTSIYRTVDGWVGVTALTPAQWSSLCAFLGASEFANDPRFSTTYRRLEHADLVDQILAGAFSRKTTSEWIAEGIAHRVPIVRAEEFESIQQFPHWRARQSFVPVPGFSPARGPGRPFPITWFPTTRPTSKSPSNAPLAGIRVADFTMGWAGPLATRHLADLGAEVLKLESTSHPDWWRSWEENPGDREWQERQFNFLAVNRNKHGLGLDLKTPKGRKLARNLIATSDVVVHNFAPGVMDRFGLDSESLRALQPGIIELQMSAFGGQGEWSGLRAYGTTMEQASGMPFANASATDGKPCLQHSALGDPVSGVFGAAAVLVALLGRRRFGGARIDLSQIECLFQIGAGLMLEREGPDRPDEHLFGCFPCVGSDQWVAISATTPMHLRDLNTLVLGKPGSSRRELVAAMTRWTGNRTPGEVASVLQAHGIPAVPAQPAQETIEDPQLKHSEFWLRQNRPVVGWHTVSHAPYRLNGQRLPINRYAPMLGGSGHALLEARTD